MPTLFKTYKILIWAIGVAFFVPTLTPTRVDAAEFHNDYPYLGAMDLNPANYDWWVDENGNKKYDGSAELISPYNYAYRNCTDGVAYWIQKYTGIAIPHWGNANNWNEAAANLKYAVKAGNSSDIEPGDIAQSDDGSHGHVGFIISVNKNSNSTITSFTTAELNAMGQGEYNTYSFEAKNSAGKFKRGTNDWDHFIDVNGPGRGLNNEEVNGAGSYPDGAFLRVNESGAIYRMVGGAPIRVYNQGAIPDFDGGKVRGVSHDTLSHLPRFPTSASAIVNFPEAGNAKYRFVGGAPIRLFNCGAISDCSKAKSVNFQALVEHDHMLHRPKDGAVLSIAEAGGGGIYRFVGSAPVRLFDQGAIRDMPEVSWVNEHSLATHDHMNIRPSDGAAISLAEAGGGGIYRFVGGAPIRLFNQGAIPNMPNVVTVNSHSLAVHDHMNERPTNGSIISIAEAGGSGIYRFVGGAPLRLFNWGIIPNFGNAVNVNAQSVAVHDHMNTVPTAGEFIASIETGIVYRIAGGAPLRLYNHGGIPGSSNFTYINQQTIDTNDHMFTQPADNTFLKGISSGSHWQIMSGKRMQTDVNGGAITVDEQTISDIPLGP